MKRFMRIRHRIANSFRENVWDNPVAVREFRTRMRGVKAFAVMGCYVLLTAGILLIAYAGIAALSGVQGSPFQTLVNFRVGQKLFLILSSVQAILLALIIPATVSGSLTMELERKTIHSLALTRLTPGRIVLGKQLSGFGYAFILLLCSVPVAAMCVMFGGISPMEVFLSYVLLCVWAFLLSAICVFWSSMFKRTASATLMSFGSCMCYYLFTCILAGRASILALTLMGMPSNEIYFCTALSPIADMGQSAASCQMGFDALEIPGV